jgi:hypothetical protein
LVAVYPFGQPTTRRPPRRPDRSADLFILGVYPSALHVRWQQPGGVVVGALAVDDEPTVFWDGADARQRISHWRANVGWRAEWGTVTPAGGNGSSGRAVVDQVLRPLRIPAERTYFTDCLPYYFVKTSPGSQGHRIDHVYQPFATAHGLPQANLPHRPPIRELVRRAIADETVNLQDQFRESGADTVVTLGEEAAAVFAAIVGVKPPTLRPGTTYGQPRPARINGRRIDWIPLTHPGNRAPTWRSRHAEWAANASD